VAADSPHCNDESFAGLKDDVEQQIADAKNYCETN